MRSGDPRERRRCPAWRLGAVFTEWCRSFEALPSRMWDSGRDHHPAGCEVSREALQQESSPRIAVGRKPLTEESSCEAGYISATSAFHAQSLLRNAAGPYIRVTSGHQARRVRYPIFGILRPLPVGATLP